MNLLRNLLILGLAIFVSNTSVAEEDYFILVNRTPFALDVNREVDNGFIRWPWMKTRNELIEVIDLQAGDCVKISSKYIKNVVIPVHVDATPHPRAEDGVLRTKTYENICSLGKCKSQGSEIFWVQTTEGGLSFGLNPLRPSFKGRCHNYN